MFKKAVLQFVDFTSETIPNSLSSNLCYVRSQAAILRKRVQLLLRWPHSDW